MRDLEPDLYLGVDVGTEGVRAALFDAHGSQYALARRPYATDYPRDGWAEQHPDVWWTSLCAAVRDACGHDPASKSRIVALSVSSTGSSPLLARDDGTLLSDALMWMDLRSSDQATRLAETHDDALGVTFGSVSAESFLPKAMWLAENETQSYEAADYVCEGVDWLAYKLTGRWTSNRSLASLRAYYRAGYADAWPVRLLEGVGFTDLLEKLAPVGDLVGSLLGGLTERAARDLDLTAGIPVATSAADAECALAGLGVTKAGRAALITGSSHLLLSLVREPTRRQGLFGTFDVGFGDDVLLLEGGQSSSGSIVRWWKEICTSGHSLPSDDARWYADIVQQASHIEPGSGGVRALDFWQGNRTPYVDDRARGMIWGLSLSHGPAHVYRAILESICYGTENIMRRLQEFIDRETPLPVCGGATRNSLWLQMHADVSGVSLAVPRVTESATLGNAIFAATAAGVYGDLSSAADAMVQWEHEIRPDERRHDKYQRLFEQYIESYMRMSDLMHRAAS